MAKNVIIRPSVREQYQKFMARGRVLFFTAPCGFGKSTLAETLLAGQQVLSLTAGEPDFALPADDKDWQVLLIDDLRQMTEEPDQQALCQLIREYSDRRFVLLSRGAVPGWLMAFQYAGLMAVLDADALLFDREDIRSLFRQQGTPVSESELSEILRETSGYPLGVAVIAHCMAGGRPYGPELIAQGYHEVFFYFEAAVYRRFDLPIRRFLLELAPFESFDAELARMVSGDPHAGERLAWLQHNTTMLRPDDVQRFRFWPQFRTFLLWEMDREYSEEKRRTVLGRGGLYYELKEDYSHALECYTMAGDHSKVSELLVRNAELHPGMGHYSEMEKYYRSLPEQEIAASPALMQGMSMLCALAADYEGSERWYQALSQFARCRAKSDAAGRQARGRLAWLDISLLLLRAVAQYRLKDEAWQQSLTDALRIAAGLGFIRPVSCCGAALLPLLQALPVPEEESWYRQVVAFARVQASRYPYFLVPPLPPGEEMTATELQVLRLMCADKSNAEIGRILDIKLPTVKTHVSHILTKLNVSRRSEAKTAARRLWLVE